MDILAEKIAEFLEIGIDKAIEIYPLLRGQFIAYEITSSMITFIFIAIIILGGITLFSAITYALTEEFIDSDGGLFEPERKQAIASGKIFKVSAVSFVISMGLNLTLTILRIILSPDLIMFKQFL